MKLANKALFAGATCLIAHAFSADVNSPSTIPSSMPSNKVITECVNSGTKLAAMFGMESSKSIDLSTQNIPFFDKVLKGRTGIEVVFRPGKLKLDAIPGATADPYVRRFSVLLDESATKVIMVRSKTTEPSKDIHSEAPAADAEAELRELGEVYAGFPEEVPKFTFLDAVEIVRQKGIGYPPLAQEIDGLYVLYSRLGEAPHPVWVITLRGLPPFDRADLPAWEINHMRNIVDAVTGKWLFANNRPSPLPTR